MSTCRFRLLHSLTQIHFTNFNKNVFYDKTTLNSFILPHHSQTLGSFLVHLNCFCSKCCLYAWNYKLSLHKHIYLHWDLYNTFASMVLSRICVTLFVKPVGAAAAQDCPHKHKHCEPTLAWCHVQKWDSVRLKQSEVVLWREVRGTDPHGENWMTNSFCFLRSTVKVPLRQKGPELVKQLWWEYSVTASHVKNNNTQTLQILPLIKVNKMVGPQPSVLQPSNWISRHIKLLYRLLEMSCMRTQAGVSEHI